MHAPCRAIGAMPKSRSALAYCSSPLRAVAFAMCISNCVAPEALGRGAVVFPTSLMDTRFADIGTYPSDAAIGITMLILAFLVACGLSMLARRLIPR